MADSKIDALTLASTLTGVESMPAVQSGADRRITPDLLAAYLSSFVTGKTNGTGNTGYTDGKAYYAHALSSDGFPADGYLTGERNGTNHVQRLQAWATGQTYARHWINGSAVWSAWSAYLDASDFTAKGQTHFATASGTAGVVAAPTVDGQNLVSDSSQSTGVKWSNGWTTIRKTTQTQVKNNSAVLAADDTLAYQVPANAKIAFRLRVFFQTLAAADFKWRIQTSGSHVVLNFSANYAAAGTVGIMNAYTDVNSADVPVLGTGTGGVVNIEGVFHNGVSINALFISWAQNTATVGNTLVLIGSYFEYLTI